MITNRDVLEWNDANSEEFDTTTTHRVVVSMPEHNVEQKGGTMRLGERISVFRDTPEASVSMMKRLYGNKKGENKA
jgi:CTP synthase 1-B